jgi:Ras-related protein Rab-1A
MSEFPECPKCSDIFGNDQYHIKAPKLLNCGDSICKECLGDLLQNTNEEFFLCPVCEKKVKKEENIDEYITNKDLIKIVNGYFNAPENKIEEQEGIGPIQYNIILLGNSAVGKTSIFNRFSGNKVSGKFISTIGCDTTRYYIKYKNQKYKLNFRDPAGQEKFKAITKSFMKQNDGVLFIFDISNRESFEDLKTWCDLYKEQNENFVGILIGNKSDCKRKVSEQEAKSFASEHGLREYFETSATLDKNIKKSITYLLEQIIKSKKNDVDIYSDGRHFSLDTISIIEKKKCSC